MVQSAKNHLKQIQAPLKGDGPLGKIVDLEAAFGSRSMIGMFDGIGGYNRRFSKINMAASE